MIITISDMWKNQQKMLDNDNQIKLSSLIVILALARQKKDRDVVTALEHERDSAREVERNMTARPARSTHTWAQLSQPRFGSTARDGGAAPLRV